LSLQSGARHRKGTVTTVPESLSCGGTPYGSKGKEKVKKKVGFIATRES